MSQLSKFLYLCAIVLLAWLAAKPHWPTIKEEAKNFYTAWQQIRSSDEGLNSGEPTEDLGKPIPRERAIAAPTPAAELPAQVTKEGDESLDPFIKEARERALADPEAAMQWLQEQSTGAERLRGMLEVVALWAADDSETALLWLESNAQGLARLETLNSGVELWAERDPNAAAGWIDGMANDASKISAAKSLASTWVRSNPAEASAWLDGLPNGPVREEATSALALSWMEIDPESAVQWANLQFSQSRNVQMIDHVVKKFTRVAPEKAEAYIRNSPIADPDLYQNYITGFVETRAADDPAGTAEWLQTLPESDPFQSTTNATRVMQVWTETDSIAASTWLSELPLSPERDAAIVGFAETIQRFEPGAAATWASTISDPTQRSEQLTSSIRNWAKRDPQGALKWVIETELAPALKESLGREIGVD